MPSAHTGLIVGLSAALAVAVALAVVLVLFKPLAGEAASPTQDLALRSEVKRVAEKFTVNVNTYRAEEIETYRGTVEPLMTPRFRESFNGAMTDIVEQMRGAKLESRGEVLASAVSSVDADSATVLVVSDAAVDSAFGERQRHFRWRIDLVNGGDQWRVDGFTPL